jgi:hypothetical protein
MTWDAINRIFNIDTADDTAKTSYGTNTAQATALSFSTATQFHPLGTNGPESFWIEIKTRGMRTFYKKVETILICGNEVLAEPSSPIIMTVKFGDSGATTEHQFTTYTSDIPRLCGIISYKIEDVKDKTGNALSSALKTEALGLIAITDAGKFTT